MSLLSMLAVAGNKLGPGDHERLLADRRPAPLLCRSRAAALRSQDPHSRCPGAARGGDQRPHDGLLHGLHQEGRRGQLRRGLSQRHRGGRNPAHLEFRRIAPHGRNEHGRRRGLPPQSARRPANLPRGRCQAGLCHGHVQRRHDVLPLGLRDVRPHRRHRPRSGHDRHRQLPSQAARARDSLSTAPPTGWSPFPGRKTIRPPRSSASSRCRIRCEFSSNATHVSPIRKRPNCPTRPTTARE